MNASSRNLSETSLACFCSWRECRCLTEAKMGFLLQDQETFFGTSREKEVVPARAHAAYTEVGPGNEDDDVVSSIVGTCPDMCPGETLGFSY